MNAINKRMNWLDWMKAIGMYLIVYGHFTSYGHKFIYIFSVPLFFVISGFLFKHEVGIGNFLKKNFYNLIVPMLIMVALVQLRQKLPLVLNGTFDISQIWQIITGILIGNQKIIGACWFIYTLFIVKFFLCVLPDNRYIRFTLFILFSVASMIFSHKGIFAQNAIVNVLLSYPFFYFGTILRKYKTVINEGFNTRYSVLMFFITLLITYMCSIYNGHVWVYINDYGNNFLLYLVGGFSGTALIYIISKWLDKIESSIVSTISIGSIIILGLHFSFIRYMKIRPELDFVSAFILLLLFVPIIRFCERRLPILIGIYRTNKSK